MAQRAYFHKLGYHIFEEAQLLAEKNWIVMTLAKIKHERNCLQIERLHLESMKGLLKGETKTNIDVKKSLEELSNDLTKSPIDLMQNIPKSMAYGDPTGLSVTDEEIYCNEQALDLMISDCIYAANHQDSMPYNVEEDEEDDDDIMIDMNMLMNGNAK